MMSRESSEIGAIHRALTYRSKSGEQFIVLVGEDGRVAPYVINMTRLQAFPGPTSQVERERIGDIFAVDGISVKNGAQFEFKDGMRDLGNIRGQRTDRARADIPVEDPYWNCKVAFGRAVAAAIILIIAAIFVFLSSSMRGTTRIVLMVVILFFAIFVYNSTQGNPSCLGA